MKFIHRLFCWYSMARLTVRIAILEIKVKNRANTVARLDAVIYDLKKWHNVHLRPPEKGISVMINGRPVNWNDVAGRSADLERIVFIAGKIVNIITRNP